MHSLLKRYGVTFILSCILVIGIFFRFYKLDWGEGLYAHPDEYHIVASVNQLSFPNQMHPHFFSYGTVTIYLIYFTKEILAFFNSLSLEAGTSWGQLLPVNVFLIGRFYSALFSTMTIFIVYKLSQLFLSPRYALLAAFFVAITPGLIQQAHFTTPESNLIFFLFGSLLFLLYFLRDKKLISLILSSVFLGFALGVKISSIVFLLPLFTGILLSTKASCTWRKSGFVTIGFLLVSSLTIFTTFAIVAPYVFLDFPAFYGNVTYEGSLALGEISVFYTRQFINTTPILFQLEKIFPYALGLPLLITGIAGCILSIVRLGSHLHDKMGSSKIHNGGTYFILIIAFFSLFLPNAFLFAKWTRFIAVTFPFFAIFSAFLVSEIAKKQKHVSYVLISILIMLTSLWTCAFFTIYIKPDVRVTASNWLEKNIPHNSTILIEGGNMVDIPLGGNFKRQGFDFYNLEEDALTRVKITDGLENADYFLVQSRRVFMNHQRLPGKFPKTASFYNALFNGSLGFKQIQQFDSYPQLYFLGHTIKFPDEKAEETWSVFDHPVIRIFKKNTQLSKEDYAKIFEE